MAYSRDEIAHAYSQYSVYFLLGNKEKAQAAYYLYSLKSAFTMNAYGLDICNN